jgi:hypothetical protein
VIREYSIRLENPSLYQKGAAHPPIWGGVSTEQSLNNLLELHDRSVVALPETSMALPPLAG